MPIRQKVFAVLMSVVIFVVIIELVRKRKLREEYSWLWLATGAGLLVLTLWYDLLVAITRFIGAALPTSTLFFFGLIFVMLLNLHHATKNSKLTDEVKNLAQKIALLEQEIKDLLEYKDKKV